jgi:hypothetical protein
MAAAKKALEDVALLAGTQQNLINLYSLDIYGGHPSNDINLVSFLKLGCTK